MRNEQNRAPLLLVVIALSLFSPFLPLTACLSPPSFMHRAEKYSVVLVQRSLQLAFYDMRVYHHAGIVLEVDEDGKPTMVLHFDPTFDQGPNTEWSMELINRAVGGMPGHPQLLVGEDVLRVFPERTSFYIPAPTDPDTIDHIENRIEEVQMEIVRGEYRVYKLHEYNCQHFAMEMQTGAPTSVDLEAFKGAFVDSAKECGDWLKETVMQAREERDRRCQEEGRECTLFERIVGDTAAAAMAAPSFVANLLGKTGYSYLNSVHTLKDRTARGNRP